MMQILGLIGMYFDVVEFKKNLLSHTIGKKHEQFLVHCVWVYEKQTV